MSEQRLRYAVQRFLENGDVLWQPARLLYQTLAARLPGSTSVLDVGCGCGFGTVLLGDQVTGVDSEAQAIAFARVLYPWVRWEVADFVTTFEPGRQWDWVVCIEAIEHMHNQELAARKMREMAREVVWLSTPPPGEVPTSDPRHVHELTRDEVAKLFLPWHIENAWAAGPTVLYEVRP
jgi:2-polyprenyl-3-methyl-5-hydroxy-6-metoxy-1,4-benzoquinol methylase